MRVAKKKFWQKEVLAKKKLETQGAKISLF